MLVMLKPVLLMIFLSGCLGKDVPKKPHIIMILADDLGWDDLSFHGSKQIPTPHIDALAYNGVILNQYYAQSVCVPSRSALMTGRHPIHIGTEKDAFSTFTPSGLRLNETLLPQYLKQEGYKTHAVGKWHLGYYKKEYTPTYRGFDSHFGFWEGAGDYYTHSFCGNLNQTLYCGLDLHDGLEIVRNETNHYSTELFTTKTQDIIEIHNTNDPLFIYLAHQAVHSACGDGDALEAPKKYTDRFPHIKDKKRRIYAGMVSALDDSVGNITRALHSKGILDNTIIIFMSDNGGPALGVNGNMACNMPLRGMKATTYEGGVRVASFIWSPLLKSPHQVSNQLMHVSDWVPTLVTAAGGDASKLPAYLYGIDHWHALNNPHLPSPRTELLHKYDIEDKQYALRVRNYKLVKNSHLPDWYPASKTDPTNHINKDFPPGFPESDLYHIFQEVGMEAKKGDPVVTECGPEPVDALTNCNPKAKPCLYDISLDPCEYHNIAAEKPEILESLIKKYKKYKKTVVTNTKKPIDLKGLPTNHNGAFVPWGDS